MKQDTLEGKAKTKNGVKRLCFSIICILLEVVFIITIVTRLNEYAEIINLFTRILSGDAKRPPQPLARLPRFF